MTAANHRLTEASVGAVPGKGMAPARMRRLRLLTVPRREGAVADSVRRERSSCSDGGRLTLERRLDCVWEGLHAVGVADCPMCGSHMQHGHGGGRCGGCGTSIA